MLLSAVRDARYVFSTAVLSPPDNFDPVTYFTVRFRRASFDGGIAPSHALCTIGTNRRTMAESVTGRIA